MSLFINDEAKELYNDGWQPNGEWICRFCGTMWGCNLFGDKPYIFALDHANKCGIKLKYLLYPIIRR